MEVSQKFKRIRANLVGSGNRISDDEELKHFSGIESRNAKTCAFVQNLKKDLINSSRTGYKEENIDKRKKKVEESNFIQNFKDASVDLEYLQSPCLHEILHYYGNFMHYEVEETVKYELNVECKVIDELQPIIDNEKAYTKQKEKGNTVLLDLSIAQKAFDKEATQSHQESVDAAQMKIDSMRDVLAGDALIQAGRQKPLADIMVVLADEKIGYLQKLLDELKCTREKMVHAITHANPRPVFGVDLREHLQNSGNRIATVVEKCCTHLRKYGFQEKGLFRVSANAQKIRRVRAAFDVGFFDADEKCYIYDPNPVASVLKLYLRELPEPLLTNRLMPEFVACVKEDGEKRLAALESVIDRLPTENRDNLTFLIHFLSDFEREKDVHSMNASNIAIVFSPGLTGMDIDNGNAAVGTMVVEALIVNASRLFGIPGAKSSYSQGLKAAFIDIPKQSSDTASTHVNSTTSGSVRSSLSPRIRPKDKAPPPPMANVDVRLNPKPNSSSASTVSLVGSILEPIDDEWDDDFDSYSESNSLGRSFTERRPHRPPPPNFRNLTEAPSSRPVSYTIAVGAKQPSHDDNQSVRSMVMNPTHPPTAPERKRQSLHTMSFSRGSLHPISPKSAESLNSKPVNIVTGGDDHKTYVSLDGEASSSDDGVNSKTVKSSSLDTPLIDFSTPISNKPKPPLPHKPKVLGDKETSRL